MPPKGLKVPCMLIANMILNINDILKAKIYLQYDI